MTDYPTLSDGELEAKALIGDTRAAAELVHRMSSGDEKARFVPRIGRFVAATVVFDPLDHPRDYRGRFIDTPDVTLPDGSTGVAVSRDNQTGKITVAKPDGSVVDVGAAQLTTPKVDKPKVPQPPIPGPSPTFQTVTPLPLPPSMVAVPHLPNIRVAGEPDPDGRDRPQDPDTGLRYRRTPDGTWEIGTTSTGWKPVDPGKAATLEADYQLAEGTTYRLESTDQFPVSGDAAERRFDTATAADAYRNTIPLNQRHRYRIAEIEPPERSAVGRQETLPLPPSAVSDEPTPQERYARLRQVGEWPLPQSARGQIAAIRRLAKADGLNVSVATTRDYVGRPSTTIALVDPSRNGEIARPDEPLPPGVVSRALDKLTDLLPKEPPGGAEPSPTFQTVRLVDEPLPPMAAPKVTPQLETTDYEGRVGDNTHITRVQRGTLPTAAVATMRGARGETPGEHRNMQGAKWEKFKADVAANGITEPLFITVDYGAEPVLSEGNHRRDAAVELGLSQVPVEIKYFGHAEQTHGGWAEPLPPTVPLADIPATGKPDATGTIDDPIAVGDDLELAVRLIGEGKHVRLDQPEQVATLLSGLRTITAEAKRLGVDAPKYDLCKVSVAGTNLFCTESLGVPRVQMPQLEGIPIPGSIADSYPKSSKGVANMADAFMASLRDHGIDVTSTRMPASHLRASQGELDGAKVAGIMGRMIDGTYASIDKPMFVTRDGYIIDGHHRWAARVGVDAMDNKLGDIDLNVHLIDLDIGAALDFAHDFAAKVGLPVQGIGDRSLHPDEPLPPYPAPPGYRLHAQAPGEYQVQDERGNPIGVQISQIANQGPLASRRSEWVTHRPTPDDPYGSVLGTYPSLREASAALPEALAAEEPLPPSTVDTAGPPVPLLNLRQLRQSADTAENPNAGMWAGIVADGAPPAYRNVGNWAELLDAVDRGGWKANGGFTVDSMEGRTQFTTSRDEALGWNNGLRDARHTPLVVEATLDRLGARFSAYGQRLDLANASFTPSTGLGLGIDDPIPLDRITGAYLGDKDHPLTPTELWALIDAFAEDRINPTETPDEILAALRQERTPEPYTPSEIDKAYDNLRAAGFTEAAYEKWRAVRYPSPAAKNYWEFDDGEPLPATAAPEPAAPVEAPTLTWTRSTNEFGQKIEVADSPFGQYVIDGNGTGRMRWSVTYPPSEDGNTDSGITDTRAEARAWAQTDVANRTTLPATRPLGVWNQDGTAPTVAAALAAVDPADLNTKIKSTTAARIKAGDLVAWQQIGPDGKITPRVGTVWSEAPTVGAGHTKSWWVIPADRKDGEPSAIVVAGIGKGRNRDTDAARRTGLTPGQLFHDPEGPTGKLSRAGGGADTYPTRYDGRALSALDRTVIGRIRNGLPVDQFNANDLDAMARQGLLERRGGVGDWMVHEKPYDVPALVRAAIAAPSGGSWTGRGTPVEYRIERAIQYTDPNDPVVVAVRAAIDSVPTPRATPYDRYPSKDGGAVRAAVEAALEAVPAEPLPPSMVPSPETPGPDGRLWLGTDGDGNETFDERLSRCYELAGTAMLRGAPEGSTLVHGTIQGMGRPRLGHAWVQLPNGDVWEPISRDRFTADAWRKFANPTVDREYDKEGAIVAMAMHGTYGAWHPVDERGVAVGDTEDEMTQPLMVETGRWVRDADGNAVAWEQDHRTLVEDALYSWAGWPSDMRIHMADAEAGAPQPGSGSGKKMRAQAEALLTEIRTNGKPTPRLYRGANDGNLDALPTTWTEDRTIAARWAKKGTVSVHTLDPGDGRGIRMADYISSNADQYEKQWLVIDPASIIEPLPPMAAPLPPSMVEAPPRIVLQPLAPGQLRGRDTPAQLSVVRLYRSPNGGSMYLLRDLMNGAVEAIHQPDPEHLDEKRRRVGLLQWFPGSVRRNENGIPVDKDPRTRTNINGGIISGVAVRPRHQREGVASAMLAFAREQYPELEIRHSSALSDDGRAWSEAYPMAVPDTSYRGQHQPPSRGDDVGNSMDDMEQVMPDLYSRPDLYVSRSGDPDMQVADREALAAITAARGNPDAKITVYRAVPPGVDTINPGDWVTPSRTYAQMHGRQTEDPAQDWPVISREVRAGDLLTSGDSLHEFGWQPAEPAPPTAARRPRLADLPVTVDRAEPRTVGRVEGGGPRTVTPVTVTTPEGSMDLVEYKGHLFQSCGRCGGTGSIPQFGHVYGGVCFECNGAAFYKDLGEVRDVTARIRRRAQAATRAQRKADERVAARAAAWETFRAAHQDLIDRLLPHADGDRWNPAAPYAADVAAGIPLSDDAVARATEAVAQAEAADAAKAARVAVAHYGAEIGAKAKFTGTVKVAKVIDGYYGSSMFLIVEGTGDDEGVTVKTFGTGRTLWDAKPGDTVTIAGTVKDHDVYDEIPQTVLTRTTVTIVDPAPEPLPPNDVQSVRELGSGILTWLAELWAQVEGDEPAQDYEVLREIPAKPATLPVPERFRAQPLPPNDVSSVREMGHTALTWLSELWARTDYDYETGTVEVLHTIEPPEPPARPSWHRFRVDHPDLVTPGRGAIVDEVIRINRTRLDWTPEVEQQVRDGSPVVLVTYVRGVGDTPHMVGIRIGVDTKDFGYQGTADQHVMRLSDRDVATPEALHARLAMIGARTGMNYRVYDRTESNRIPEAETPPQPTPPQEPRTYRSKNPAYLGDAQQAREMIPSHAELIDQGLTRAEADAEWKRLYRNAKFRVRRARLKREAEWKAGKLDDVKTHAGEAPITAASPVDAWGRRRIDGTSTMQWSDVDSEGNTIGGARYTQAQWNRLMTSPNHLVHVSGKYDMTTDPDTAGKTFDYPSAYVRQLEWIDDRLYVVMTVDRGDLAPWEILRGDGFDAEGIDGAQEFVVTIKRPADQVRGVWSGDDKTLAYMNPTDETRAAALAQLNPAVAADLGNYDTIPKALYTLSWDEVQNLKAAGVERIGPGAVTGQRWKGITWADRMKDVPEGTLIPVVGLEIQGRDVEYGTASVRDGMPILIEHAPGASESIIDSLISRVSLEWKVASSGVNPDVLRHQTGIAWLAGRNPSDAYWQQKMGNPLLRSAATGGDGTTTLWDYEPTASTLAHEFGHNIDFNAPAVERDNPDTVIFRGSRGLSSIEAAAVVPAHPDGAATDTPTTPWTFEEARKMDNGRLEWLNSLNALAGFDELDARGAGGAFDSHPIETFASTKYGPTNYGRSNVKEDFAESVRLYLRSRQTGTIGYVRNFGDPLYLRFVDLWPHRAAFLDQVFGLTPEERSEQYARYVKIKERIDAMSPAQLRAALRARGGTVSDDASEAFMRIYLTREEVADAS